MKNYVPRLILAGLILVLAVGGCARKTATLDSHTLHRSLGTDPETLDPQRARSVQAGSVLRDLGEGLVTHSPQGEVVPGVARSWTVSDDGMKYVFKLRPDARWSNSDPILAGHFVAAMQRLVDPATGAFYANTLSGVENADAIIAGEAAPETLGVIALDDQTLCIRLESPVPYLLALLTHPSMQPVHPSTVDESATAHLSNGAYRLSDRTIGTSIELSRNEHYWRNDETAIDNVIYHVMVEERSELARYRAGELHITDNVPPENFAALREEFGSELRTAPYLGVYYYGFNLTRAPFKDNPKLRQALSMAVDRDVIVEKLIGRGEAPAYSWVPPGTHNYDPPALGFSRLSQEDRNDIARRLYKEAGYGDDNPLRTELRYNTSETQQRIAVAVQAMWHEILGVETTLVAEEFQILLQNIRERQITEVFRGSWIGDYDDANTFLALLESSNPSNLPGYSSPDYDELMQSASSEANAERRRLYLEEAERVLLADHAMLPLYFYVSKHLIRPEVEGFEDNVLNYHYSRHLRLREQP